MSTLIFKMKCYFLKWKVKSLHEKWNMLVWQPELSTGDQIFVFLFFIKESVPASVIWWYVCSPTKGLLENSKEWKVLKNETSSPLFHSHKQHRVYSHAFWNRKSKRIQCVPLWLDKHATELTSIILASQTVQKMNIVNNEWREGHKTERTGRSDICFAITQTTNYPINQ